MSESRELTHTPRPGQPGPVHTETNLPPVERAQRAVQDMIDTQIPASIDGIKANMERRNVSRRDVLKFFGGSIGTAALGGTMAAGESEGARWSFSRLLRLRKSVKKGAHSVPLQEQEPIKRVLTNEELWNAEQTGNVHFDRIVKDIQQFGYDGSFFYKRDERGDFAPTTVPDVVYLDPVTAQAPLGYQVSPDKLSADRGIYLQTITNLHYDHFVEIDEGDEGQLAAEGGVIPAVRMRHKDSYHHNRTGEDGHREFYAFVMGVETQAGIELRMRDFPKNEPLHVSTNHPPLGVTANYANTVSKPNFTRVE